MAGDLPLSQLQLQDVRCHSSLALKFKERLTVFVGPNAAGKTTILEAVRLLATGKSFRTDQAVELVAFEKELARVQGVLHDEQGNQDRLELILTRGVVQGKKTASKLYRVNGAPKHRADFIGHLTTVTFRPEDMRLIEGSPQRRRQFLDEILSTLEPEYDRALTQYEAVWKRRNKVLEQIRDSQLSPALLPYWNQQLLAAGLHLQARRTAWCEYVNTVEFSLPFEIVYQPSVLTEERLAEFQPREIAVGHALIGPHKDDFEVFLRVEKKDPRSIMTYGSRGQQRLAVVWLKWCEYLAIHERLHRWPVLLFDDVFSELDPEARTALLPFLEQSQVLLTSADGQDVEWLSETPFGQQELQRLEL
jgi:DNA replication and repair protein RecF